MPYILEYMKAEDIADVAAIERLCFSMPWPVSAYRRELRTPETNRYIVARYVSPQDARTLGLPEPDVDNLTSMVHPALSRFRASAAQTASVDPPTRSLIDALLPWRRHDYNDRTEAVERERFPIIGYAGLWLMVDEGHVTTIGVHPTYRGRAVGELLFLGLVDIAQEMHAYRMTLEVRVSNYTAQALYRKYGFENAGVRKRYYSDNGEDAYIMWSEPLSSGKFRERVASLRADLVERMRRNFREELPPSRPVDAGRLQ